MKSILINLVRRISLRLESNTSWRISPFFNILSLELNQMICAYNDYYTSIAQHKLGSMLELAVHDHGISAGEFAEKFVESPVCRAFEYGDPVFLLEKSANELLGMVVQSNFFCKKIQHFDRKIQLFCKRFRALACFSGLYRARFEGAFNGR